MKSNNGEFELPSKPRDLAELIRVTISFLITASLQLSNKVTNYYSLSLLHSFLHYVRQL
jgi:hypothetical protein